MINNSTSFCRLISVLFHIGIGLILSIHSGNSQTIEDYRKSWKLEKNKYAADGQNDAHSLQANFHARSRAIDDEFSEYLSESWHDYIISPGIEPAQPKAHGSQPVFKLSDLLTFSPPASLPCLNPARELSSAMNNRLVNPCVRKPETDDFNKGLISFRFYGNEINLSYDKLLLSNDVNTVSEENATAFWQQFTRSNNNHLIDQLMNYRDLLGLNDWGYFCLLKETSLHLNPDNKWANDLLTWALALHSGFQVKLAYNQTGSTILFPCANTIYSRQFVIIDQTRYYLDTDLKSSILATYNNNLKSASRTIDLAFYKSLNFKAPQVNRKIMFKWNDKQFEFNFGYNPSTIRFYEDYPHTDALVYFDSPVSSRLKEDLYSQFYPIISKMNKAEASAFLQQFVQDAIEFQPVNSENGSDRFLFPEEVFARKACNDKGHAVAYAWLMRNLVKLPVIGLEFHGFFSTAVCFDKPVDGDYYLWHGNKYTFVDPTYLNAPVGIIMPELAKQKPEIINLTNSFGDSEKEESVWNLAVGMGAARGGNYRDFTIDGLGRSLVAGYFENAKHSTSQTAIHPFIACFSENNSLQWLRKFEGSGKAYGFAVENLNADETFMAGSFRGEIKLENIRLHTFNNQPDLFFAKFNRSGELLWMKKAGIDSLAGDSSLTYLVNFDSSGDNFYTHVINEDDRNVKTGFFSNGDNWIYFTGSRNGTTGTLRSATKKAFESPVNIPSEIKKEHSRLLSAKYNPTVAGVAAVLQALEIQVAEIKGRQLQALLNQYNPSFGTLNPQLYNAIGQIETIRNKNGIISITTIDQKSIILPGIKLTNNAQIMLDRFGNGDISIGIISGLSVGKQGIWISLNSLLMDLSSGNLVFDYDNDHTLRTINFDKMIVRK